MRLATVILAASALLQTVTSSVTPRDIQVTLSRFETQLLHSTSQIHNPSLTADQPVDPETDAAFNRTLSLIDRHRICTPEVNVTLSVPEGNITYFNSYLIASKTLPPTVWTIKSEPERDVVQVSTLTPFGQRLYWQVSGGSRVYVSTSDYPRWEVRQSVTDTAGYLAFSYSGYCLAFNHDNGESLTADSSACHPISFRKHVYPEWETVAKGSEKCAREQLSKIESEAKAAIHAEMTLMREKIERGEDVDAEGFFSKIIGYALKKGGELIAQATGAAWVRDAGYIAAEAVEAVF